MTSGSNRANNRHVDERARGGERHERDLSATASVSSDRRLHYPMRVGPHPHALPLARRPQLAALRGQVFPPARPRLRLGLGPRSSVFLLCSRHIMQESVTSVDLRGVFSVPPLPRTTDSRRSIDFDAAEQVARHLEAGGITDFSTAATRSSITSRWPSTKRCSTGLRASAGTVGDSERRAVVRPRDGSGVPVAASRVPVRHGPAVRRSARSDGHGGRPSGNRSTRRGCRSSCI